MVINRIVGFFSRALGVILLLMVALNAANAVGRHFFVRAIEGADEVLVYSMIWLVYLGAALVSQKGQHLRFQRFHMLPCHFDIGDGSVRVHSKQWPFQ